MSKQPHETLPVFVEWMRFLQWLMPTTANFPKRVRFTFTHRIENLALDIIEDLIEACYIRNKQTVLRRANLRLEKLRILLRLSKDLHYLSYQQYEHAIRCLASVGKQLGGWIKQQNEAPKSSI